MQVRSQFLSAYCGTCFASGLRVLVIIDSRLAPLDLRVVFHGLEREDRGESDFWHPQREAHGIAGVTGPGHRKVERPVHCRRGVQLSDGVQGMASAWRKEGELTG
jgi:hypothetical protein